MGVDGEKREEGEEEAEEEEKTMCYAKKKKKIYRGAATSTRGEYLFLYCRLEFPRKGSKREDAYHDRFSSLENKGRRQQDTFSNYKHQSPTGASSAK